MANTLHEDMGGRKIARCTFGTAKMNFTVQEDGTVCQMAAVARDWMKERGQGDQWQIERNPQEAIDFDFEYPIIPIPQAEEATIFLKQVRTKVRVNEPWKALSDRLVQ
jgi:hypothetical protein